MQIYHRYLLIVLAILISGIFYSCTSSQYENSESEYKPDHLTVKVAVVYQNPKIDAEGGKQLHEVFGFNDPKELNRIYKDSMEAVTYGNVTYEIVDVIEEDRMWTRFKDSTEYLSNERIYKLLSEPGYKELKDKQTKFDYRSFVEHHNFGKRRDEGEINEVWVWTWPFAGMWESLQVGQDAFWCNSEPLKMDNEKILTVMGFNYERTADLAMHSFGHRAESVLRKVYGRWKPIDEVQEPNNWELFTSIAKDAPQNAHIGNTHYPPNGEQDYDYANEREVASYAHMWEDYPNLDLKEAKPQKIDCTAWNCNQMGYMSWMYRHFPHYSGIDSKDQKLNNWWHYILKYESAVSLENELKK